MIPMNNPMMAIMQAAMGGMRPAQFLQQMAMQNPMATQAMNIIQGKSPEQLREIADNMAKQRGTTVEEIARQYGLPMNNQTNQSK